MSDMEQIPTLAAELAIDTTDLHTVQEATWDEETGTYRVLILADLGQIDLRSPGIGLFTLVERELQIVIERSGVPAPTDDDDEHNDDDEWWD